MTERSDAISPPTGCILPPRPATGHKGTFGTVLVIGGCAAAPADHPERAVRMFGGAALAALAALRTGCGLARLMTPAPVMDAALMVAPVCTGLPVAVNADGGMLGHVGAQMLDAQLHQVNAVVIGPALGTGEGERSLVLRAVGQDRVPVVVDADGLNRLAETPDLPRDLRAATVLTPHPGEFARLAKPLGVMEHPGTGAEREQAAMALARKLACTVVLKGASTVAADGERAWMLDAPNPALAAGGSGDVLAGIIGSLLAQHFEARPPATKTLSLFETACLGVAVHAMAGRAWTRNRQATGGMLAGDLLDLIPACVRHFRCQS